MKTLIALAFASLVALAPQAEARDKHKEGGHHRSSHNDRSKHGNFDRGYGDRYFANPSFGGYGRQFDYSHRERDTHQRRSGPAIHLDF